MRTIALVSEKVICMDFYVYRCRVSPSPSSRCWRVAASALLASATVGCGDGSNPVQAAAGATGSNVVCVDEADCLSPSDECVKAICVSGSCSTEVVPAGTPTLAQTPGDCKQVVCDGQGAV